MNPIKNKTMLKRILFFLSFIFILSACKKEYSCVCTNPSGDTVVFTEKNTRDDAKKKCEDYYNEHFASVPWNETSCAIK